MKAAFFTQKHLTFDSVIAGFRAFLENSKQITVLIPRYSMWRVPVLGVSNSSSARTYFEKFLRIFPLSTRAIAWD